TGSNYGASFSLLPISSLVSQSAATGIPVEPAAKRAPTRGAITAPATLLVPVHVLEAKPSAASAPASKAPTIAAKTTSVGVNLSPAARSSETVVKQPAGVSAQAAASYEWNFGDNTPVVKTVVPYASHDFEAALGTTQEFQAFHVSVKVTQGG